MTYRSLMNAHGIGDRVWVECIESTPLGTFQVRIPGVFQGCVRLDVLMLELDVAGEPRFVDVRRIESIESAKCEGRVI